VPISEYNCGQCKKTTEILELSHKRVKKKIQCPDCGGTAKKIMSQGDFHLKGSGWYKDGYK
jgi:putative FmdB family regulatory protein